MNFHYTDIDADLRDSIERGITAIRQINLHQEFANWMAVGQACRDMQTAAMRLANTNQPKGRAYNDAFKVIAHEASDLAKLDKAARSNAVWMADPARKQVVIDWHSALPANIRQQVNHPTTVKRRFERDHAAPKGAGGEPRASRKDAEIVRLQEELDAANTELRRLRRGHESVTEGRDWTWQDKAGEIGAAWFRINRTKAIQAASEVLRLAKSTTAKPSD